LVKLTVPGAEEVATKWAEEAPRRATYLEKKAPAIGDKWLSSTVAAGATFKAAITAPDIDKRFVGGVKKAGPSKIVNKLLAVGVARYGPGITAAKDDYKSGIAPYLEELAKIDLPSRAARGDPSNYKRVETIGSALHKKRLAALAAGT